MPDDDRQGEGGYYSDTTIEVEAHVYPDTEDGQPDERRRIGIVWEDNLSIYGLVEGHVVTIDGGDLAMVLALMWRVPDRKEPATLTFEAKRWWHDG